MVMECGMSSEIGPVFVPDEKSAETRRAIDSEVGRLLKEAYLRVRQLLVSASAALGACPWGSEIQPWVSYFHPKHDGLPCTRELVALCIASWMD